MKKAGLVILILINIQSKAQILFKLYGDSLSPYSYSGGDEFNALTLNESNWKNGLGGRRVLMTQDLAFSPKNVNLENGLICFKATKEDSTYILYDWEVDSACLKKEKYTLVDNKFSTKYVAGGIVSKNKFHYGFYEIRFKVEEGRGVWPAFWFYGGNKNEEIDVFEIKCEKNNYVHVDTHCPYGCDKGYKNNLGLNTNWGAWMPLSNYLHEGFNIMALEWKTDELIWYLNGSPVAYFKGKFSNPMRIYLNTSVAKDGGAFKPGPDETTKWPNTYSVDYLRVWKLIEPKDAIVLNANDEQINSSQFNTDYKNYPKKKNGYMYRKKELNPVVGTISLIRNTKNKLFISVLGKTEKMSISIRGVKTNYSLTEFDKEIVLVIDPQDKELEMLISTEKQQYRQKLILQ